MKILDEILKITQRGEETELKKLKKRIHDMCMHSVKDSVEKGIGHTRISFAFFYIPQDEEKVEQIFQKEVEYWNNQGFDAKLKRDDLDFRFIKISWKR